MSQLLRGLGREEANDMGVYFRLGAPEIAVLVIVVALVGVVGVVIGRLSGRRPR